MRLLNTSCIAAGVLALLSGSAALANDTTLNVGVDPPRQLSDFEQPIRMASEHISIHFGKERSRVEVEFTFENLSEDFVTCTAGFPDEDLLMRYASYGPPDSKGRSPEELFPALADRSDMAAGSLDDTSVLTGFKAWSRAADAAASANAPLETRLLRIERIAYENGAVDSLGGDWHPSEDAWVNSLMFCRSFTLSLDPHQKIIIGHSYETENGSNVESQRLLNYTLGTGRTWRGSIGKAIIDVYLEDGQSVADLHFNSGPEDYGAFTNPPQADWKVVDQKHLRAFWEDFEPEGNRAYIMLATQPHAPAL